MKHIASLVEAPELREYQTGGDKHANLVVHRVTAAVTQDSRYIEWANKFDEKTEVRPVFGSISYDSNDVRPGVTASGCHH